MFNGLRNSSGLMLGAALLGCVVTGCGAPSSEEQQISADVKTTIPPDFDIRGFGFVRHDNPYMRVAGKAGGTLSTTTDILAYVFITDAGIFAVTSHEGVDTDEQSGPTDNSYHTHKVTLDANNCVTSLVDAGPAVLHNHRVTVLNTNATSISSVLTARLTVSSAGVCVAQVFDSMDGHRDCHNPKDHDDNDDQD